MLTVRTLAKPSSPFPSSSRPQHGTLPVDPWIHRVTEMFHRLISILPSQASMWVPLFLLGLCMTINGIVFFLNESYVSWWRRKVWNHSGESGYKFDKYLMHFVVRSRGFEPPHPYGYIHLKHARLPIPPRPQNSLFDPTSSHSYLKLVSLPPHADRSAVAVANVNRNVSAGIHGDFERVPVKYLVLVLSKKSNALKTMHSAHDTVEP